MNLRDKTLSLHASSAGPKSDDVVISIELTLTCLSVIFYLLTNCLAPDIPFKLLIF